MAEDEELDLTGKSKLDLPRSPFGLPGGQSPLGFVVRIPIARVKKKRLLTTGKQTLFLWLEIRGIVQTPQAGDIELHLHQDIADIERILGEQQDEK